MKTDKKDLPVNVRINIYRWANKSIGLMEAEPSPFILGRLDFDGKPRDFPADVKRVLYDNEGMAAASWTLDGVSYWYSVSGGLCSRPVGYIQADPWL